MTKIIKGYPVTGISFELSKPYIKLGIERDTDQKPILLCAISRRTQFKNWFHMVLIVLRLGKPWFSYYNGLVLDEKA